MKNKVVEKVVVAIAAALTVAAIGVVAFMMKELGGLSFSADGEIVDAVTRGCWG
jgi:hypothetical protein